MNRERMTLNYEMAEIIKCSKKRDRIPVVVTTEAEFEKKQESLMDTENRTFRRIFRIVQQSDKEPWGEFVWNIIDDVEASTQRMLNRFGLISYDLNLSVIQCNCPIYDDNIGPKIKKAKLCII